MDELIVAGKNVLHPADFHRNKAELARIRNDIPTTSSLPYFKEKNWIFDANVKGEDMNELVRSLQGKLTTIHNTELGLTNVIDTFINAFESLDKGYLQGICIALKAGQEADKQATDALDKINATLKVLKQFKDELKQNTKHLNDIDAMWDGVQDALNKCRDIEKKLRKESELIQSTSTEFQKFQKGLSKIKHLVDVDSMHSDLSGIKDWQKYISTDLTEIRANIDSLITYKKELKTIQHLHDVDGMFEKCELMQNTLTVLQNSVESKISTIKKDVENVQSRVDAVEDATDRRFSTTDDTIQSLQNKLEELQTSDSKQFLNVNKRSEELQKKINVLENAFKDRSVSVDKSLKNKETDISNLQETLDKLVGITKSNAEGSLKEIDELKVKLKKLYILLGGVAGIVVVQFILSIVGVI